MQNVATWLAGFRMIAAPDLESGACIGFVRRGLQATVGMRLLHTAGIIGVEGGRLLVDDRPHRAPRRRPLRQDNRH